MTVPSSGFKNKVALKIETADFGTTSVACGAGDILPIVSITTDVNRRNALHEAVVGDGGRKNSDRILDTVDKDVTVEMYYENAASLLMLTQGMGYSNPENSPTNPTAGVYKHLIELSDDLDKRAFNKLDMETPSGDRVCHSTLCREAEVSLWEFLSVKFGSIKISGNAQTGNINVVATTPGHSRDFDTATNPNSDSWTGNYCNKLIFQDMVVRVKAIDEYTIDSTNDAIQFVEDTAGTPDDVTIDIPDGTYSGAQLATEIARLATAGSANSITYSGRYIDCSHKFEFRNTTDDKLIQIDYSDSDGADTIGFYEDPTAGITIGSQVGGVFDNRDIGDTDKIPVSEFEINLNNNLETNHQTTDSGFNIEEPLRNSFYSITLMFKFPRLKDDTFQTRFDNDTLLCGDISFTGSTISGAYDYEYNFLFPQFKCTAVNAPVQNAGLIEQTVNAECSNPYKDKVAGWDNGVTSASDIGTFTINEISDLKIAASTYGSWQSMAVYNGKMYIGSGYANAGDCVLYDMDSTGAGALVKDFGASYEKLQSMVAFEGYLYMMCQTTTNQTHIYRTNDLSTFTNVETIAKEASQLHLFKGLIIASFRDGDIYSSADGLTYTARSTTDLEAGSVALTSGDGVCYACGVKSSNREIISSADGITWASLYSPGSGQGYNCGSFFNGYIVCIDALDDDIDIVKPDGTLSSTVTGITQMNISHLNFGVFKGYLYTSGLIDGTQRIITFDGHNQGSYTILEDIGNEVAIFQEFNGRLFYGLLGDGNFIYVRAIRPLQQMQIEAQNDIDTNPFL